MALKVIPWRHKLSGRNKTAAVKETYHERRNQFEKQVLRVVVRRVEREQDDLGDELDGRGLNEDTQDGHEVSLAVSAVGRRPLVRLPDPEGHETGGQAGLDDRDGVEGSNPMKKAGVEYGRIRIFGRIETADRVARD